MASFTFSTVNEIRFGSGRLAELGELARGFGERAFVVCGYRGAKLDQLLASLTASGVSAQILDVYSEPTVALVSTARDKIAADGCDLVIGFGGGSAMDTAKAAAVCATNPGPVSDYLEIIGQNLPLQYPGLPVIAVPTTAGTGSEVTRNAVLAVPEQQIKVSLRGRYLLPQVALIDPEVTFDLPPAITAASGMDALTQVIEPYVSRRANDLTDLYCREGILRAGRSLYQAVQDGHSRSAREDMAYASLMGGLALANAGLGAVHGFAGPIGGMFNAPHGAVCAALLPGVVRMNARALAARQPHHPGLARYAEIALWLTGNDAIESLFEWLDALRAACEIPTLSQYGITSAHFSMICDKAAAASSMKANPIELTASELLEIIANA